MSSPEYYSIFFNFFFLLKISYLILCISRAIKIVKFEKWADRKLAYTIQDYKEGRYYLLETDCSSECIKELESILSFEKTKVLRFIIDKIENEIRCAKFKFLIRSEEII